MKKKVVCLVLALVFLMSSSMAFAFEIGTVLEFKGNVDKEIPKIQPRSGGAYVEYDVVQEGPKFLDECVFVRYLTDSWANSDGYDWIETNQVTLGWSGSISTECRNAIVAELGLAGSVSTSYSVNTHIPADPNRPNKLAYGSDFIVQSVSCQKTAHIVYSGGTNTIVYDREYGTYKEPTEDTYLYIVYK